MKVLHLIDSGGLYGAETMLLHLMQEQKHFGITPTLGSLSSSGAKPRTVDSAAEDSSIQVVRFTTGRGLDISGALAISRYTQEHGFALIHTHGYKANILMGILPAQVRRVPRVATMHGWTALRPIWKRQLYQLADLIIAARADAVVVVSESMRRDTRWRWLGIEPMVVPNGIPDGTVLEPSSMSVTNPKKELPLAGFVAGTIARLSPEKGVHILIRAAAKVAKTGRDISVVIIGDGPERGRLERLASQCGIERRVHFWGYQMYARRYMSLFDAFILSSSSEGMPLVVLEAMQSGAPIIATRVGGVPEMLGNGSCGLLVDPGDEGELASAMTRLHDFPHVALDISHKAKRRMANEYSSRTMALGYRNLYQHVVKVRDRDS